MAFTQIAVRRDGAVGTILHNRPEQRNAESSVLLDEMDQALGAFVSDPEIRVIVFGGAGDHFSAGHDLKEAAARRSEFTVEQRWAYEEQRYLDYSLRIWDCPKPTIASVQGACIAGGFMVANMCDLIVAADDAYFADPVAKTLAACAIEVLVHPYVMGLRAAKELLFTGRRMTAEEAHRVGMVNRVVPRAELEAATMALAQDVAQAPPFALKLVKRSLNRAADLMGFRQAVNAHFDTHQLAHVTEEFKATRAAGLTAGIARGKAAVTG
jgi:enoyl-CoA hydratase